VLASLRDTWSAYRDGRDAVHTLGNFSRMGKEGRRVPAGRDVTNCEQDGGSDEWLTGDN
jgi:hypothetical protein